MVPDRSRRKVLQAFGSALTVTLAGCNGLPQISTPQVDGSLGTTAYEPVIGGQPLVTGDVPVVWGIIFSHPDAARKLIDWGMLTPQEGDAGPGTEFRTFDPNSQFMTVVVGVLPTGDGLTGYRDKDDTVLEDIVEDFADRPTFDNGQLRYEVTTYQAFSPDPDTPDHHYDYTFTLWNLNGNDLPSEIIVNFHTS